MRKVLLAIAAIALPAAASAETLPPSPQNRAALGVFNRADRDGDRALSRAEILAQGRERAAGTLFRLLDADSDGALSLKEVEAGGGGARLGRFQAYDANRDGKVARGEFPNFADPLLLAALDRDGDRRLSLVEFRPAFAGTRPRAQAATPAPRQAGQAAPETRPWCWVPAFGDDGWGLEAPVLSSGRCRTL